MIRDMKWHIYNTEHQPLCWDDNALEFDSREDAYDFLHDLDEDLLLEGITIIQNILYYDGGYINATDLRIVNDELVKKERK